MMADTDRPIVPTTEPDWRGAAALADPRVELAAIRTGLALERTRMNADRTLMAVMRTANASHWRHVASRPRRWTDLVAGVIG